MLQLLGIFIVLGTVFGGFVLSGGQLGVIWQPMEVFIIAGAGLGALVLGKHILSELWLQLRNVMSQTKQTVEFQRQLPAADVRAAADCVRG